MEDRGRRADLIEVFQIINGIEKMNVMDLFQFSMDTTTRGHNHKLIKSSIRTDVRKYFFSQRVVNDWNIITWCGSKCSECQRI